MRRRAAGVVLLALVLFVASFAIARAGRPEAEPAAAAKAAPAEPLKAVTVREEVGDLRKLPPASLPRLARTPEPTPSPSEPTQPDQPDAPAPQPQPQPQPESEPPAPEPQPPAPDPEPPQPDPDPEPPGGSGCDPC